MNIPCLARVTRQSNTDSVASFEEAYLIFVVAPYETQDDYVVFLALVVVYGSDFDPLDR
jgi:hypothetical protein